MKKLTLILVAMMALTFYQAQEDISLDDYRFTTSAAKSGLMELKLAQLAVFKGETPEIKALGEKMIVQHTQLNKQIKRLADQRGLFIVADLDEKQQKNFRKLSVKKGEDFDKAYVKHVVRVHKSAIVKLEKEVKNGQDPDLVSWASATLLGLERLEQISEQFDEAITLKDRTDAFNY